MTQGPGEKMNTFIRISTGQPRATPLPQCLVELVILQASDWTLPRWRQLFNSILELA